MSYAAPTILGKLENCLFGVSKLVVINMHFPTLYKYAQRVKYE